MTTPTRRRPNPSEEGYILVAVIFMMAILVIAMSVAAPKIAKEIQRDRELETMHRGKQYARAVKLYYKKFGAYPPNIDALVKTNEIRFLRKKYVDPTTGKEEWKPIRYGQQKTQSTGFFGQAIAGAGASGGLMPGSGGLTPGAGGAQGGTGLMGGSPIGGLNSSNGPVQNSGSTDVGSGNAAPGGSTDQSSGSGAGQNGGTSSGGGIGTNSGSGSAFGTPGARPGQALAGQASSASLPTVPSSPSWCTGRRTTTTSGSSSTIALADQMMMQGGNAGMVGQPVGGVNGGSGIGTGGMGGGGIGGGTGIGGGGIGGGTGFGTPGGSNPGSGTPTPQPQEQPQQ